MKARTKILFLIAGLIIAFLIMEVGFRIFYPQSTQPIGVYYDKKLGTMSNPTVNGHIKNPPHYDYYYNTNSIGFRGSREYSEKTRTRILTIGDSFTKGVGVADDETFSAVLEKNTGIEVVNSGVSGKGTDYALKLMRVMDFDPDAVALFFYFNDYFDNSRNYYYDLVDGELVDKDLSGGIADKKNFLRHIPLYSWLGKHSQAFNYFKTQGFLVFLRTFFPGHMEELFIHYNGEVLSEENIFYTDLFLEKLKEETPFTLFYIPQFSDVISYREGKITDQEKTLEEIVRTKGIEYVSLTPVISGLDKSIEEMYYAEAEGSHWTPISHLAVGEFLAEYFTVEYFTNKQGNKDY